MPSDRSSYILSGIKWPTNGTLKGEAADGALTHTTARQRADKRVADTLQEVK